MVVVREHAWLNCEGRGPALSIGSGSYLGRFAHVNAARSVVIEDEVLIADRVHISDYQHAFADPDARRLGPGDHGARAGADLIGGAGSGSAW